MVGWPAGSAGPARREPSVGRWGAIPSGSSSRATGVIAGDGSLGGYGGAWYGTREALLAVKRELLALEGIRIPAKRLED